MLILHYPPFRANDAEELLRQSLVGLRRYVLELDRYGVDALDKGWSAVLVDHRVERWPTIGTIVEACARYDRRPGPVLVASEASHAERERIAERVLASFTGHEAAREGWCHDLRIMCMREGREPTDAEIEELRRGPERAARTYADMKARHDAGEEVICMDVMTRARHAAAERERELAARVLGEQAGAIP